MTPVLISITLTIYNFMYEYFPYMSYDTGSYFNRISIPLTIYNCRSEYQSHFNPTNHILRIAQQLSQLVCKITSKKSSRGASFFNFYIERDLVLQSCLKFKKNYITATLSIEKLKKEASRLDFLRVILQTSWDNCCAIRSNDCNEYFCARMSAIFFVRPPISQSFFFIFHM